MIRSSSAPNEAFPTLASAVARHAPSTSASPAKDAQIATYGLLGLLPAIHKQDQDLSTLALGIKLTSLGLDLKAEEPLYAKFTSPLTNNQTAAQRSGYTLPNCYKVQTPALKTGHLTRFTEQTLLYIFYAMPRDVLQAYAAQELYKRGWKFHATLKLWFIASADSTSKYQYFDINSWERKPYLDSIDTLEREFLPADSCTVST